MNKHEIAIRTKTVRDLLENPQMRRQMEMAIPRHLTVDRLLRTVMTAIRSNPVLLDCTQESLLASVMACCQLGLEPEPFLGQAYLVPFKNQVVFIPGYRGYIALARRSGEVQSVSSQVVYENDYFKLQYGTEEKLEHVPTDGNRGEPKGAYVIFKYKDGGHSFDYMTAEDIDKIRSNFSKQPNGLMWKENWPEAAKKTVIRRHVKLVPLAVEIQRAAALEDRAYGGESQFDIVFPEPEETMQALPSKDFWMALEEYCKGEIKIDKKRMEEFIVWVAEGNNQIEPSAVMEAAAGKIGEFLNEYNTWVMNQAETEETENLMPFAKLKKMGLQKWEEENRKKLGSMALEVRQAFVAKWQKVMGKPYGEIAEDFFPEEEPESSPETSEDEPQEEMVDCPNTGEQFAKEYCDSVCRHREGCPVFE